MILADIEWKGESGKEYGYWIHPIGTGLSKDPGNYIYAKKAEDGGWVPVYIGQADSLQRPGDQEVQARAREHGATHVHAHTSRRGQSSRSAEMADLVAKWHPPCNG